METYYCIDISNPKPDIFKDIEINAIGRYKLERNGITHILDVIYEPVVSNTWRYPQISEYFNGTYGLYNNWKYDIKNKNMRSIVMMWIDEIPLEKRDRHNVIRHIMSKLSSDNAGNDAVMIGNWSGDYSDSDILPSNWKSTSMIFDKRIEIGRPVKYAQCWCFAECMTSICRFLGIAARTVMGKNTLIDEQLDNGVDFFEELRKSENIDNYILVKDKYSDRFINFLKGIENEEKAINIDDLSIYNSGDSFWNFHYWLEVFLPRENSKGWEILDPTPLFRSKENDEYCGKKILGPCKQSTFKTSNIQRYDFEQIFSFVNSPFRVWVTDNYIDRNGNLKNITFVYALIYTYDKSSSVYINSPKIQKLFNFHPTIKVRDCVDRHLDDITDIYIPDNTKSFYFKDMPISGNYYIQYVYLDSNGNIINVISGNFDLPHQIPKVFFKYYLVSVLMINNEESENNCKKWFTYLEYYIKK